MEPTSFESSGRLRGGRSEDVAMQLESLLEYSVFYSKTLWDVVQHRTHSKPCLKRMPSNSWAPKSQAPLNGRVAPRASMVTALESASRQLLAASIIGLVAAGNKVTLDYRPVHTAPLTTEAQGGIPLKKIAPAERKF